MFSHGVHVVSRAVAGVGAAALTVTGAGWLAAAPATATPGFAFHRISGHDRYATSAKIAEQTFPHGADTVIIASGVDGHYPDSLAGNYLAGQPGSGAPVLLVKQSSIPSAVQTAIDRIGPAHAVIVGGHGAVAKTVADDLRGRHIDVARRSGHDRFDTMQDVDEHGSAVGTVNGKKTAIVANGENFPDALASGPIAYAKHLPIVLVRPHRLVAQARDVLGKLGVAQVIIAGGFGAVGKDVEASINNDLHISTLYRARGTDRSDTARKLADFATKTLGFDAGHLNLATGAPSLNGVDALSAGPYAGTGQNGAAPLLITDNVDRAGYAVDFAAGHCETLTGGHLFGGQGAISPTAASAVATAARSCGGVTHGVVNNRPELTSVHVIATPRKDSRPAEVAFTFDEAVASVPAVSSFHLIPGDDPNTQYSGGSVTGAGTATVTVSFYGSAARPTTHPNFTAAQFSKVTVATVDFNAVRGGTGTSIGTANPIGAAPVTAGATMPGRTDGPDLTGVTVGKDSHGDSQAVFQFDSPVGEPATNAVAKPGDPVTYADFFHLFQRDGKRLTCRQATYGADGHGNVTEVVCGDVGAGSSAANSAAIGASVLGTVNNGAVHDVDGHDNPEGAGQI